MSYIITFVLMFWVLMLFLVGLPVIVLFISLEIYSKRDILLSFLLYVAIAGLFLYGIYSIIKFAQSGGINIYSLPHL